MTMVARSRHPLARGIALVAAAIASTGASAGSEESTAELLILPLAIEGRERTSELTLSNGSATPVVVRTTWSGATGTPLAVDKAGPMECDPVAIDPSGARTLPLRDVCPFLRTADAENRGYLRLRVDSDQRAYIGAAIVTTTPREARFRVDADPLGAHDIAAPTLRFMQDAPNRAFRDLDPLQVQGIEGEVAAPGGSRDLVARCWIAAPDAGKQVEVVLRDESDNPVGRPIAITLRDGEMQEVDVLDRAGLAPGLHQRIRALVTTPSTGPTPLDFVRETIVAGCGSERLGTRQIDYRRARTPAPSDATRQAVIDADIGTTSGPFSIGAPLENTAWGDPRSTKAVVAVFVQPEDRIACTAVMRNPSFATLPNWLELQVKDAAGRVIAGGDRAAETGLFETGPRDRKGGALAGAWTIEVSLDEVAYQSDPNPPGGATVGPWGVMCESGAGLSQPILQTGDGFTLATDDF
jgi:hypothetical protein